MSDYRWRSVASAARGAQREARAVAIEILLQRLARADASEQKLAQNALEWVRRALTQDEEDAWQHGRAEAPGPEVAGPLRPRDYVDMGDLSEPLYKGAAALTPAMARALDELEQQGLQLMRDFHARVRSEPGEWYVDGRSDWLRAWQVARDVPTAAPVPANTLGEIMRKFEQLRERRNRLIWGFPYRVHAQFLGPQLRREI